jgi:hypothetical protein
MHIVAPSQDLTIGPRDSEALAATIAERRARIAELDALVREARDVAAGADAALDSAVRERTRVIFEFEQLRALIVPEQE